MNVYEKKETILKVENVSINFKGTQVLSDINIEIKDITRPGMTQGQIVGLVGPSGLGKTQLFEILSGIKPIQFEKDIFSEIEKSKRNSTICGKVLLGKELNPVKIGDVGVIQQGYPLFEHRTVFSNLDIAAKVKYKDDIKRKEKIQDLLHRFDIDKKKNYYPYQLSGGQRQRVAISQQLLSSNNFLFCDEIFSSLDINMIKNTQKILREVSLMDELNTIVIISHDIASTAAISDTLWVMGRNRNEKNEITQSSTIKYKFDLIERNIAWRDDVENTVEFIDFIREVKGLFVNL